MQGDCTIMDYSTRISGQSGQGIAAMSWSGSNIAHHVPYSLEKVVFHEWRN